MSIPQWKTDNYKFVGKTFDYTYANRMSKLKAIIGEVNTDSVDYELTGSGGYGEMPLYDGINLNRAHQKRGFKAIITPQERSWTEFITLKQAKNDKSGECRRVGQVLANSAFMTVYVNSLRLFAGAFTGAVGGDGKTWAATDHPVASMGSIGRTFTPDPESGTFSNLMTSALTVSAITDAQARASKFVTPDGLPVLLDMNMLLVSPELEATAKKICGENAKYRPIQSPDGDTYAANPVPDLQYMVIGGGVDGFSAKQWALCDPLMMRETVKLVYNTAPKVFQHDTDNPLIDTYTSYADFALGWGDARAIIFSDPA